MFKLISELKDLYSVIDTNDPQQDPAPGVGDSEGPANKEPTNEEAYAINNEPSTTEFLLEEQLWVELGDDNDNDN